MKWLALPQVISVAYFLPVEKKKDVTTDEPTPPSSKICGGALGPDWAINRSMKGAASVGSTSIFHGAMSLLDFP